MEVFACCGVVGDALDSEILTRMQGNRTRNLDARGEEWFARICRDFEENKDLDVLSCWEGRGFFAVN